MSYQREGETIKIEGYERDIPTMLRAPRRWRVVNQRPIMFDKTLQSDRLIARFWMRLALTHDGGPAHSPIQLVRMTPYHRDFVYTEDVFHAMETA